MTDTKSNISLSEIEKFSRLAESWWDKNGPMKSLHDINPLRLDYVMQQSELSGKRVLDVGCGGGLLTEQIASQGAVAYGIDASSDMIGIAQTHALKRGLEIRYINTDIEHFQSPDDGGFDLILCMELLEHVPDYRSVIQALTGFLNPGGKVIFATINRNFLAFFLAVVCAEYILGLLPRGTHQYGALIRPEELEQACRHAGLRIADIRGFSYNPVTRTYYLCRNTLVNYLACFRPF